MSTCPVCLEPLDPKGRVVHRCTPQPNLPPPPRPQESGFVPPPQGSRAPVFVLLGLLALAAVGVVVALVAGGGGDEVDASATTEVATATTVPDTTPATTSIVDTTLPATTVAETVPPTPAPTPAPPPPPTEPSADIPTAATGCQGDTPEGTVPRVFDDALKVRGTVTSCRFGGRWALVILTSAANGLQEGWLFNVDEPLEFGRPLPLLGQTPSGCILGIVGDPVTAVALSVELPPGDCPPA